VPTLNHRTLRSEASRCPTVEPFVDVHSSMTMSICRSRTMYSSTRQNSLEPL
jgi:hypothetical protein